MIDVSSGIMDYESNDDQGSHHDEHVEARFAAPTPRHRERRHALVRPPIHLYSTGPDAADQRRLLAMT